MSSLGLRGDAAVVGIAEYPSVRRFEGAPRFHLEQWLDLAALALTDAGLRSEDVNGLVCYGLPESAHFVPSTIAEYAGWEIGFGERVDLGGAWAVGALWRAAAAIELGLCDVVVIAAPGRPAPPAPVSRSDSARYGATSAEWGSPQSEFDIPYGNLAQNSGYAMIAERYAAVHGWDERAVAKVVVDQRTNANANPLAAFAATALTIDEVLASRLIAGRLHLLEIVMPCTGGAAVVVAGREPARRSAHRPAFVTGCGEQINFKTPTYGRDMLDPPVRQAARKAFAAAGCTPGEMDVVLPYDCYAITVLLTLEAAGFCRAGEGMAFVRDHDLTYRGDFPVNTHGGQLGAGQAGLAGPMSHIVEGVRQLRGDADGRQLSRCDSAFVTGNGGILSEQNAVVLRGG
jgi:acetyl-CoA acetyltransferase